MLGIQISVLLGVYLKIHVYRTLPTTAAAIGLVTSLLRAFNLLLIPLDPNESLFSLFSHSNIPAPKILKFLFLTPKQRNSFSCHFSLPPPYTKHGRRLSMQCVPNVFSFLWRRRKQHNIKECIIMKKRFTLAAGYYFARLIEESLLQDSFSILLASAYTLFYSLFKKKMSLICPICSRLFLIPFTHNYSDILCLTVWCSNVFLVNQDTALLF